jgi:PAS domain-containing protein
MLVVEDPDYVIIQASANCHELLGKSLDQVIGRSIADLLGDDAPRLLDQVAPTRALHIMVGGGFFLQHPDCVVGVGADGTAQDGRRAVLRVSSLLGTNALR